MNTNVDMRKYHAIEVRESQLWWLSVLIILLLAMALFVIDMVHEPDDWWLAPQLKIALNTRLVRVSLVVATLLICAYFRDNVRRLRRRNSKLVHDLATYGSLLEKKNREVTQLKDLSDDLIQLADLRAALELVLGTAVEMIGADRASVMLREKDSDLLRILASRGLPPEVVEHTEVRMGQTIAGLVAKEGRPLILNSDDLTGEMARRAVRKEVISSSLVVPIQLGDDVRGVINIAKHRGKGRFTEDDLHVLSTLANQASLVIQKIELLDDMKNQVDVLATTVQELRQTQAELMQSEKLASVGQLASGMAHEINSPLQVILGRTELLLSQEKDDEKARYLKSILEHTHRIADIVLNLLNFSRQSTKSEHRELNIDDVLNETLGLLEPQMVTDNVAVVRDFQDDLKPISGNSGQLQQVFTNIILNACQAMRRQGGGTLTLRTRCAAGTVRVEIADTGPGIPKAHLDRLFEPFFTTKAEGEGTGLGLSIAYGIVKSHKGAIEVHSARQEGACFVVCLPVIKQTRTGNRKQKRRGKCKEVGDIHETERPERSKAA